MVGKNLSVLLVEDSQLLADRLREIMQATPGIDLVATVDNELAAIALLRRQPIDVVLLDLHLHGGTGFGVLRAIHNGEGDGVTAIVLTNHDLGEYRRAAAALGARYFLDKLRDFDRLPDLLQKINAPAGEGAAGIEAMSLDCAY